MHTPGSDSTRPHLARSALLVIDMQVDFCEGGESAVPGTARTIPRVAELIRAFREAERPIVHVVRLYDGDDVDSVRRDGIRAGRQLVRPGTPGAQVVPELRGPRFPSLDAPLLLSGAMQSVGPREEVLWKPRWSAFFRTTLGEHLAAAAIDTVVVAGCNFPNCPRATAYDATARDLRVIVASDAVSRFAPRDADELLAIGAHAMSVRAITGLLAVEPRPEERGRPAMISTLPPVASAGELQIRSTATAPRYEWGDGCEGWRLLADDDLSVIEERMPPGTTETWHLHARSKQLFYVTAGDIEVRTDAWVAALGTGESVGVEPGVPHCVVNTTPGAARFLVVSAPPTVLDRHAVAPPDRWAEPGGGGTGPSHDGPSQDAWSA